MELPKFNSPADGFPVGALVDVTPARRPLRAPLTGHFVDLVPFDPALHGDALWAAAGGLENQDLWPYLFAGPFAGREAFDAHFSKQAASEDPLLFAIIAKGTKEDQVSERGQCDKPATDKRNAQGHAALMRMEPAHRVIEVGNILYSRALRRTAGATEAMYLLAKLVFDELGYRRYEWKCNALNAPSRRAALRLGFQFEGVFRQHMIVKNRTRDTAWFAIIDTDWPACKQAFERWLEPANFDAAGQQKHALEWFRT